MDRHNLPGVTAKDVAEAHQQDLKIQHLYGCRALTYWFDEIRQTAFCLIEAPDEQAVKRMHNQAHGLIPHEIIEVKKELIEAFLGRIEDAQSSGPHAMEQTHENDTGFRAIMAVSLNRVNFSGGTNPPAPAERQGMKALSEIRKIWQRYEGREVESRDAIYLTSFVSVSKAVTCALAIQKAHQRQPEQVPHREKKLSIGLSTGVPLTGSKALFGDAVQLAKRLCMACGREQVMASATIRGYYKKAGSHASPEEQVLKILNAQEEEFLNRLMDVTETFWNDARLTMGELAKRTGISKAQLYRKVLVLKGLSPLDFLKEFRLQKALPLLENREGSVSEIAYEAGFTSPSYFSKCFQKRFGVLPSRFAAVGA